MKKIIRFFEKIFKLHCPSCGGVLDSAFLDMEIDHVVYKCRNCGKEWI